MRHLWGFFFGAGGSRAATIACTLRLARFQEFHVAGELEYLIKHVLQLVLRQCAALHILDSSQLLGHPLSVLFSNWCHLLLHKLLPDTLIISQIGLRADNQAWDAWAVVMNFREPLLSDVFEGGW
jgi:hypothetical protein